MRFLETCGAALVLGVAFGCPAFMCAQDAPAGGTVIGQVTCADTQRPAKFADVKLFGVPEKVALSPKVDGKWGSKQDTESLGEMMGHLQMVEVQTDVDGRFVASRVPQGNYYTFAWLAGYLDAKTIFQMAVDGGADLSKLIPGIPTVSVADGRTSQVNLSMERGAAVSGQVVWDDGSPVTGAQVTVEPAAGKKKDLPLRLRAVGTGMYRGGATGGAYSDDLGHFRMSGLAPGKYLVKAELETRQPLSMWNGLQILGAGSSSPLRVYAPEAFHQADAKPVTLHDAEERSGVEITFRLSNLYSVRGQVISAADGHGINSAMVKLIDAGDKEFSRWATVDADGNFMVSFVPPGTYSLEVSRARDREKMSTKILANAVTYSVDPPLQSYEDAKQTVAVADGDVTGVSVALTPMKKGGAGAQ